jgi:uncharacterized protein YdhG (YjbR/CyaY superfamily)
MTPGTKFESVEQYLSVFPASTKRLLKQMRETIKAAAPQAEEVISYNMPAFKQEGALVYYAGYKGHIGFYPVSSGIAAFKAELDGYQVSKGTIRLPLDEPLPLKLITKIVKFRVKENLEKAKLKALAKR